MRTHEEVKILRDVEATVVPAGNVMVIPEGDLVVITQSLGGTFTVTTQHGYMARIAGKDADALGKEPEEARSTPQPTGPVPRDPKEIEKLVWENLKTVYDPEIPVNIVDLGLVYEVRVVPGEPGARVEADMTMTAPGCGMGDVLRADAQDRILAVPGVADADVQIVWEPLWDQSMMSEAARLELGFG